MIYLRHVEVTIFHILDATVILLGLRGRLLSRGRRQIIGLVIAKSVERLVQTPVHPHALL